MRIRFSVLGALLGLGWWTCDGASAQPGQGSVSPPAISFELPDLPEGGGQDGLVRAIQRGVVYPRSAQRKGLQGQCKVTFAVAPDGRVCRIKMTRPLAPDLDSAVVRAVRQLPQLKPARQFGKSVACSMSAPVTFSLTPLVVRKRLPAADSTRLYTALSQLPLYGGAASYTKLASDLVYEYQRLAFATGCSIPRTNLGVMVTIGPNGTTYGVELLKPDLVELSALQAAFGDALAQAEEEELSAACVALLEQAARRLPHLVPAYADGQRVATRLQLTLRAPAP